MQTHLLAGISTTKEGRAIEVLAENYETKPLLPFDWDLWLVFDNRPRILDRGVDFTEDVKTFRRKLIAEASARGFDTIASCVRGRLLYQIFHPSGEVPVLPKLPDMRPKYPWAEWFDGEDHILEPGKDFDVPVSTLRPHIYKTAASMGLRASVVEGVGSVAVRAYRNDPLPTE